MINKPNFLIVGMAKAGTTSLVQYLKNHPNIFIPNIKEPRFFTYDYLSKSGYKGPGDQETKKLAIKSREEYYKCFDKIKDQTIAIGEASVETSFYHAISIPKIKIELSNPKIIILLRDPVKRAISAYSHLIREERETLEFGEAIKHEDLRINNGYEFIWSYVGSGLYYDQVLAFKKSFSDVKIIIFEDFINKPKKIFKDILSFLEVPIDYEVEFDRFNISGKPKNKMINYLLNKPLRIKNILRFFLGERISLKLKNKAQMQNLDPIVIPDQQKKELYNIFKNDIEKLENLLERDLDIWKKPYNNTTN